MISDREPMDDDDEFDDTCEEPLEEEVSTLTINDAINRGAYKANLHLMVQVSMTDTFGTNNDTPELIANPMSLHPVTRDYDSMWPHFAWLPINIIKTLEAITQYAWMPFDSILCTWHKSPNLALNIMHHNEPVATNTIKSDMPAIDGGEKYAQIFIGMKTLIMDVYPMKTLAQFPGTLMDNITAQGAPTKLVSNHAQVKISKCIQEILQTMYIGPWQSEPHYQHQNLAEWWYQDLKRMVNMVLDCTDTPVYCWLLCLMYVSFILNNCLSKNIGSTPLQQCTGTTNDYRLGGSQQVNSIK